MTTNIISTTIEILGKYYPVRCEEAELLSLQEAAVFLNKKMGEVQQAGKVLSLERIAIVTALNIAHEFLQLSQQKDGFIQRINQRITSLLDQSESLLHFPQQQELIYTAE